MPHLQVSSEPRRHFNHFPFRRTALLGYSQSSSFVVDTSSASPPFQPKRPPHDIRSRAFLGRLILRGFPHAQCASHNAAWSRFNRPRGGMAPRARASWYVDCAVEGRHLFAFRIPHHQAYHVGTWLGIQYHADGDAVRQPVLEGFVAQAKVGVLHQPCHQFPVAVKQRRGQRNVVQIAAIRLAELSFARSRWTSTVR